MNKKLPALGILVLTAVPVFAAGFTTEQATSREYLMRHGHSAEIARMVEINNARINGEVYVAPKRQPSCFARWVNRNVGNEKVSDFLIKTDEVGSRALRYFDPALDDGTFLLHDIKTEPDFDDL